MSDRYDTDQAQTGTGASRSDRTETVGNMAEGTQPESVVIGAVTSSHESEAGAGGANRSGSGGSGGSGDPADEGSGGQSMDELLGARDSAGRDAPSGSGQR